jgi:hypothetical protein
MMTDVNGFAGEIAEAGRILTLGQALSPAGVATLARRSASGLELAIVGQSEAAPEIILTGADGRLPNDLPARFPIDAGPLLAAALAARPKAGAALLLRAPRLAAWGISGRALPVRYFQMFSYTKAQAIPVAAPEPRAIAEALAAHDDIPALLLADGRTLFWGPQSARVVRQVLSLEEAAYVTALADQLGGAKDYPLAAREKIYSSLQAQARQ